MDEARWATYVIRTMNGDRQIDAALKSNIDQTTVSRWTRGIRTPVSPVNVTRFAKAYRRPVLEAFIHAGLISEADAKVRVVHDDSLAPFTIDELLAELARRAGRNEQTGVVS